MRPKTIAIDLDGTLYKQEKWDRATIGKLMPGAMRALQDLKEDGWDIVIHTARLPEDFPIIEKLLQEDGVPYDRLWEGVGKPLADVYLDDKAITFRGSWDGMLARVNAWQPWYGEKFMRPPPGSEDEQLCKLR